MKVFVLLSFALFAYASPTARNKRSVMAMSGAGFPFGTGAFAGSGFGWPMFNPWEYSRPFMPMPWPVMPLPTRPWYEGDNVCTTTKEIEDPKELQEWFSEASSPNVDYNHESEQCQGTGSKYVCFKRYMSNGVSKMQITKYECCHGFVRDPAGSGCVESNSGVDARKQNAYYYYPLQSSTSASKSGMEKVPIQ